MRKPSESRSLRALADHHGILAGYIGTDGKPKATTDAARVALLGAMGIDAKTGRDVERALAQARAAARARALAPTAIVRPQQPATIALRGGGASELMLELEDGSRTNLALRRNARQVRLPPLPPGVHRLTLTRRRATSTQTLLVAPRQCVSWRDKLAGRPAFGLWANLYTVRQERGLGLGDLTTLVELVRTARRAGAAFVGINPLHAHRNTPPDVSPYSGQSRLFKNPIYLDLEAVPEMAHCQVAQRWLASNAAVARLRVARRQDRLDWAALAQQHWMILTALHATFAARVAGARDARARAWAEIRQRDQGLVLDWATFLVLEERLQGGGWPRDWRRWPIEYRRRDSAAVARFRAEHAREVDLHVFAQLELERQLGAVARAARPMGIGIYQDLALGAAPSGFDAWAFQELIVDGARLGAPPDPYAEQGQEWGIPPFDPRRLAADGYHLWRLVLRAAFFGAGALRIDHAMGLTRQFWVPTGESAASGAYVRYPLDELVAVLALESHRANALVIGEDLGTVPPGFGAALRDAGILSSKVMMFEREPDGSFRAPRQYSDHGLATVNTHDHVPLAGWLSQRDLALRGELGLLSDPQAAADRKRDLQALRRRLGVKATASAATIRDAAHALLARTRCPLVGVSLDDLALETEPVNIPGVTQEVYPSWTRRMRCPLAQIAIVKGLRPLAGRRRQQGSRRS